MVGQGEELRTEIADVRTELVDIRSELADTRTVILGKIEEIQVGVAILKGLVMPDIDGENGTEP